MSICPQGASSGNSQKDNSPPKGHESPWKSDVRQMAPGCLAQGGKLDYCFLPFSTPTTALCTHILCHMTLQGPPTRQGGLHTSIHLLCFVECQWRCGEQWLSMHLLHQTWPPEPLPPAMGRACSQEPLVLGEGAPWRPTA